MSRPATARAVPDAGPYRAELPGAELPGAELPGAGSGGAGSSSSRPGGAGAAADAPAAAGAGRASLSASAQLWVRPGGGGRQRIRWSQAWPLVVRPTGDDRVHLVHGAGGPLGGDLFAIGIEVADGGALDIRSAGATLVQPAGPGGSPTAWARWDIDAGLGPSARLGWAPEPTVVCAGAALHSRLRVRVGAGGAAVLREIVVLGRHGERGGRYHGELSVDVDGTPLLRHTTVLDGADPVLCGPAGTAGARAVGTLVLSGTAAGTVSGSVRGTGAGEEPGVRWAWSELAGPGRVLLAVGDPGPVSALLESAAPAAATTVPSRTRGRAGS